jgi:hypothetical protein
VKTESGVRPRIAGQEPEAAPVTQIYSSRSAAFSSCRPASSPAREARFAACSDSPASSSARVLCSSASRVCRSATPRLLGGLGAFELMLRGEVPSLRGVELGLLAMATGLFGEPFALQLAACARSARDDRDQSKQDERGYYDDDDYQRGGRLPQFP